MTRYPSLAEFSLDILEMLRPFVHFFRVLIS